MGEVGREVIDIMVVEDPTREEGESEGGGGKVPSRWVPK